MTIRVILQIFCASVLALTAVITTPAPTGPPAQAPNQRGTDPEFEQRQRDLRLVDKLMTAHEASKSGTALALRKSGCTYTPTPKRSQLFFQTETNLFVERRPSPVMCKFPALRNELIQLVAGGGIEPPTLGL